MSKTNEIKSFISLYTTAENEESNTYVLCEHGDEIKALAQQFKINTNEIVLIEEADANRKMYSVSGRNFCVNTEDADVENLEAEDSCFDLRTRTTGIELSDVNEVEPWTILVRLDRKDYVNNFHILCEHGDEQRALANYFETDLDDVTDRKGQSKISEVKDVRFKHYQGIALKKHDEDNVPIIVDLRSRFGEFRSKSEIEEETRIENEKNWVILVRQDSIHENSCTEGHIYCDRGDEDRVLNLIYPDALLVDEVNEIDDGDDYDENGDRVYGKSLRCWQVIAKTENDDDEGYHTADEDITMYASYDFNDDLDSQQSRNYGASVSDYRTNIETKNPPA